MRKLEKGEKIGMGYSKEVYAERDASDRVIAEIEASSSVTFLKSSYYLNKLAHIFFPHNLPDIHASFNKGDKTILYLERFFPDNEHLEIQKLIIQLNKLQSASKKNWPEIGRVEKLASDLKIKKVKNPEIQKFIDLAKSAGLKLDPGGQNYGNDKDGNLLYLDAFHGFPEEYDIVKLEKTVGALEDKEKERAFKYLQRLKELNSKDN